MVSFAGQMVLITGAAAGIGRQLALEFVRRGASIAAIDLTIEPLERLMLDLKQAGATGKLGYRVADVRQAGAMQDAILSLQAEVGVTDAVIANAGVGEENPIIGFSTEVFTKQVTVNLIGVANTIGPVLPGFIERKRGHIIALSSLASYRGLPLMAGYCASKAGVSSFMDSLRLELREYDIQCTTICPGYIRTNMTKDVEELIPDIMSLESAVARMMRAIERKKRYLAFPLQNRSLLALNRLLPTPWGDWLTMKAIPKALRKKVTDGQ
jgi:short-subunit dehydrogenase